MEVLYFVLLLVAGVFFGLAAGRVEHKFDFIALGLLCWVIVPALQQLQRL